MSRMISRDPFAREEIVRVSVKEETRTCQWCGGRARYRYEVHTDGGRVHPITGLFCSVGCMRCFNE